ncbi:pancreatic secretory trypsin inhibitor-like [Aegotheles albertisi]
MKATGVFLLLSLALCCYQACGNYNPRRGCTKIFDPICGTDNRLYSNECLLCLQNLQRQTNVRIKNRGMCQKPSPRFN